VYRGSAVKLDKYLGQEFKADSMNPLNRLLNASNLMNQRPEFLESYIRIFDSFDSRFIQKIRKIQLQLPALHKADQHGIALTGATLWAISAFTTPFCSGS
jgi:hypothetical protein